MVYGCDTDDGLLLLRSNMTFPADCCHRFLTGTSPSDKSRCGSLCRDENVGRGVQRPLGMVLNVLMSLNIVVS
jgi:hypothetical protein